MDEIDYEKISRIARAEFNKVIGAIEGDNKLLDEYVNMIQDIFKMDPRLFALTDPQFPNVPLTMEDKWLFPFPKKFKTKKELLDFADDTLKNKRIGAVDGSQVYQDWIVKIPVGLIRVLGISVLYDGKTLPKKIDEYYGVNSKMKYPAGSQPPQNALGLQDELVDVYRSFFEHNVEIQLMDEKPNLIFTDNPLIQTYLTVGRQEETRKELIHPMMRMLYHSNKQQVPVAGIIDSPKSQELCLLVKMIHDIEKQPGDMSLLEKRGFDDVHLFGNFLGLYDRTCVFRSQHQVLNYYKGLVNINPDPSDTPKEIELKYEREIVFYYTRLSPFGVARVELPVWVMKGNGLIDELHKLICAQAAIGEGHPHLLVQAHNSVVLRKTISRFYVNVLVEEAMRSRVPIFGSTKELRKIDS